MDWNWNHRILVMAAMVSLLMVPGTANTTTVLALSLDDMVFDADAIVHARVVSQRSYRQSDGRVVTDVELAVERYLVGTGAKTVTLRTLGGQIGNMETRTAGAPVFKEGDESVLFLRQLEPNSAGVSFRLVGMTQGQFRLQTDQITNDKFVVRDLLDISILGAAQTKASQWVRPDVCLYMPYDSFVGVVLERAQILR